MISARGADIYSRQEGTDWSGCLQAAIALGNIREMNRTIPLIALALACPVLLSLSPAPTVAQSSADREEWLSLFNGKDLNDWIIKIKHHAYIEVDVPQEGGGVKHWSVEMGSPSILMQSGWKFKDLKAGDKITVELNPLRNGDPGGLLIQATLPDGRVLGNGPGRGPAPSTSAAAPTGR